MYVKGIFPATESEAASAVRRDIDFSSNDSSRSSREIEYGGMRGFIDALPSLDEPNDNRLTCFLLAEIGRWCRVSLMN